MGREKVQLPKLIDTALVPLLLLLRGYSRRNTNKSYQFSFLVFRIPAAAVQLGRIMSDSMSCYCPE